MANILCYDHHKRTCCFFNVKKCAFCLAFVGFLFSLLALIPIFLPLSPTSQERQTISIGKTMHLIMCTIMYLSILLAYKLHKSVLYRPYLIYVGISLLLMILGCCTYLFFLIINPQSLLDEEWHKKHPYRVTDNSEARSIALAWLGLMVAYVAFSAWIYSIVYRAYKVQKEEEEEQQHLRNNFSPI